MDGLGGDTGTEGDERERDGGEVERTGWEGRRKVEGWKAKET